MQTTTTTVSYEFIYCVVCYMFEGACEGEFEITENYNLNHMLLLLLMMMMLIRQTAELQTIKCKVIAELTAIPSTTTKKIEHSNANFILLLFFLLMRFCDSVGCIEWSIVCALDAVEFKFILFSNVSSFSLA